MVFFTKRPRTLSGSGYRRLHSNSKHAPLFLIFFYIVQVCFNIFFYVRCYEAIYPDLKVRKNLLPDSAYGAEPITKAQKSYIIMAVPAG